MVRGRPEAKLRSAPSHGIGEIGRGISSDGLAAPLFDIGQKWAGMAYSDKKTSSLLM